MQLLWRVWVCREWTWMGVCWILPRQRADGPAQLWARPHFLITFQLGSATRWWRDYQSPLPLPLIGFAFPIWYPFFNKKTWTEVIRMVGIPRCLRRRYHSCRQKVASSALVIRHAFTKRQSEFDFQQTRRYLKIKIISTITSKHVSWEKKTHCTLLLLILMNQILLLLLNGSGGYYRLSCYFMDVCYDVVISSRKQNISICFWFI